MPLPHLLPNILFPRAFTNNGLCPNHSQGVGEGHPTSWGGGAGVGRSRVSLAPLRGGHCRHTYSLVKTPPRFFYSEGPLGP